MKVLVSLSCGKNSVSACKFYLDKGIEFDTVTYIPYLKDKDCFKIARDFDALSPKYEECSRDGCVLCPHASVAGRVRYFEDYPIAKEIVLDIQRRCLERGYYPLRGKHYFIENEEFHCGYGQYISLFKENYY